MSPRDPLAKPVTSGGGGYVAKAVHFDGTDGLALFTNSLSATDGSLFSFSTWIKSDFASGPTVFVTDPANTFSQSMFAQSAPSYDIQLYDVTGSTNYLQLQAIPWIPNQWNHILFSASTNFPLGSKIIALYVNDVKVDVTPYLLEEDAFTMVFNGLSFYVFCDNRNGDTLIGDASDTWIGQNVSLLTGSDISLATRRLFISSTGKPTNPSGFPSSPVLFSGDKDTFPVNQGTGGTFNLTGTLTNATTSPSD